MKTYKVAFPDDEGYVNQCDAIEYEGEIWLVPEWLVHNGLGSLRPARLIRVRGHPIQKPDPTSDQMVLNYTLATDVLTGRARPAPESEIVVIEAPDIELGNPEAGPQ